MEELLKHIRSQGWWVGVHNDFRLIEIKEGATIADAVHMTFWLFTNPTTNEFVKGEGPTDLIALTKCAEQIQKL